ncbi:glutathione S-transferase family protein [Xinfangfangia sp. CPCC 101601]|uniref:Glutathione S-transferase family protein n=1 Tax=Pseudogemmobacter lacusdianii TaxID=3069608 RepID=A0ABU0W4F9_9RHOB|nr:glutathione S-transferase family protein [Xinfangfangia sp. CPCC 101601]MDQ2067950.1 glutathione S-transferase family protein [Xinfangfangia sp. CPCC 101601]
MADMELLISVGPNPRAVRFFMAENGLTLPERVIDLPGGENRRAEFLAINPAGQLPVLLLADGSAIAEAPVICNYLAEHFGTPALTGDTPRARAEIQMWLRRVEQHYTSVLTAAFRYGPGLAVFSNRVRCLPEAAEGMAALVKDGEAWLNAQLAEREWLANDRLTLVDIVLFCFVDFAEKRAGLPLDSSNIHLAKWKERVAARPGATLTEALPR